MFDRLDWSGAVGATVQAATVHMDGRRDGAREVLMYDLDETGLLACRDDGADGETVALHFVSASSRDAYERVLRSVGYLNRADEPHTGARRFAVEVVDATGFPVQVGERTLWVDAKAAATVREPAVQEPAAHHSPRHRSPRSPTSPRAPRRSTRWPPR